MRKSKGKRLAKKPVKRKKAQAPEAGKASPALPEGFPLQHYSYSTLVKFTTNPFMFKVNALNGDSIDTTSSAASVLGQAVHWAFRRYFGGDPDYPTPADDAEAMREGYEAGRKMLEQISDGMIKWSDAISDRAKLMERYSFCYFGYLKEMPGRDAIEPIMVEKTLKHTVEVDGKLLPVPLKGIPDLVYRDKDGKIVIHDHKVTSLYSDPDAIDGEKLIQAVILYLLVYAELGEEPHRITFSEFKYTQNRDNGPQTRNFEMVYGETPLMFELFYRLYQDVTDGILGKQVYVPNLKALYDREVAILAYIHRLDAEDRDERFQKMKVTNITDFLKKKITKASNTDRYLKTVSRKFVSATTLNYKDMKTHERIKMKLAEHGIGVEFDSMVSGGSVELYRYEPSVGVKMSRIEAFGKDIEQVVGVSGIRVLAPIPDSELIGFEVPKKKRTFPEDRPKPEGFEVALGIDTAGNQVRIDIREAPHMLVAGTTGSGKSVFLGNLVEQLSSLSRKRNGPKVELILLDPKMVELSEYADAGRYADDPEEITLILGGLIEEMNRRYAVLKKAGRKKLTPGNDDGIPYTFVVLDEYADLMANKKYGDLVEHAISVLGAKARAAGIHLIITTQRPSVKVVSGEIKANFPTRLAFKVVTQTDSHVVLDSGGAEKLLGKGDMLAMLPGEKGLVRLQGFTPSKK